MSTGPVLEWRLAARYLRAQTDNRFLSFISLVGAVGVALGVAVLLIVLAVMNGFESELKTRILSMASHATLSGLDAPLGDWQATATRVAAEPHVLAVAPYVEQRALLAHGGRVSGVLVRGVSAEAEARVSGVAAHVVAGRLADLAPGG
jgi:lipoprotein-releasing system permease protein